MENPLLAKRYKVFSRYRWGKDITRRRIRKVLSIIHKFKLQAERILDVGCGVGDIGLLLAKELKVSEVHGIEPVSKLAKEARSKGIRVLEENLDVIDRYSLPSHYYDLIYAGGVIQCFYDVDKFVSELKRLLKPGGHLILTIYNLAWLRNRLSLLIYGAQPYFTHISPRHSYGQHLRNSIKPGGGDAIRSLTYSATRALLINNEFQVIYEDYANENCSGPLYWITEALSRINLSLAETIMFVCVPSIYLDIHVRPMKEAVALVKT